MKSILKKSLYLIMVFCLLFLCVGLTAKVSAADETITITFGKDKNVTVNKASVSYTDSAKTAWSIETKGTTSFTPNASYSQIGSSKSPATSINIVGTLAQEVTVSSIELKMGGFSGTAGNISVKVDSTEVATGKLNAANDVTVSSSTSIQGKEISVFVSGISKGVKIYSISYTYTTIDVSNKYGVSFESNGGSNVTKQFVEKDKCATLPDEPTKTGYEFVGWFTEAGEAFDFSTPITGDITLYAKWKEISWYNYSLLKTNASLNISYSTKSSVSSVKYFEKVTEALEDYTGTYLIVYEAGKKAFNGVDAVNANITVDFEEDNTIILDEENSTCTVLIEKMNGGYAIKVLEGNNKGKYTSGTSGSNDLKFTNNQLLNTIEILEDGSAKITSNTSVLRFNSASNQNRFRYYKNSSYSAQEPVALYKLSDNEKTSTTESFTFANASLRFGIINLPVSEYEKLVAENAEFGIAIAKGNTVDLDSAKKVVCTPVRVNANGEEDASGEYYQFAVVIDDITEADYDKEVTGVAYVKIGEEYHTVQESKTFSVKTIAKYYVDLYNASTTSEDVKAALEQHIDALKALAY